MDELIRIMEDIGIPFAYDHFAEGESPDPPFICFLCPGSDNFSADGRVYLKVDMIGGTKSAEQTHCPAPLCV